jgi:tetratricopeptide (TPR) repeat protein
MATITAQAPIADRVTNAAPPSLSRPGAPPVPPTRPVWQVPVFLAGVALLVGVWVGRPLVGNPAARQVDHELARARELLHRQDADGQEAAEHARKALELAGSFPGRRAEALFLLGSAESRLAERAPANESLELWKNARRDLEEAERLGVPEHDRGRLQYRIARALFYSGEPPQDLVERLASSVDVADDRAEGYRLLADTYLRLPEPNLKEALAANEKLRMVFPIAPEMQSLAQLQAGELLVRLGRGPEARAVLGKIRAAQAPAGVLARARVIKGRSFQSEGDFSRAADEWRALLADTHEALPDRDRGPALYYLGVCLARLGLPQEAVPQWEECLKLGQGDEAAAAALALAEAALLQGPAPEKALDALSRAVAGVAGPAEWKNPLVDLDKLRERFEQAVQEYRTREGHFELALRALDLYEKLAAPGRAALLRGEVNADWAHSRSGRARELPAGPARDAEEAAARKLFRTAADSYLRAADEFREGGENAVWLAAVCLIDGQHDRAAVAALNRYLQTPGKKPERVGEAYFRLGECFRKENTPAAAAAAEAAYQNCIQCQSTFANRARYQLALGMIARGQLDHAAETLEQILKIVRLEPDPETQEKALFALGGLAFQRKDYRAAHQRLSEVVQSEQRSTTAEATKARYQLAESCRQIADQVQQTLLAPGSTGSAEESEHLQKEHRKWLMRAADEYFELARFLDTKESAGQLTPEERIQIPFLAAICRFNLGEYETALDIYDHLAKVFSAREVMSPVDPAAAAVVARYPQFRLEALAGVVRCHAALGQTDKVRGRLDELRAVLQEVDEPTRAEYLRWLKQAERSLQP